jgi:hypothetical protein
VPGTALSAQYAGPLLDQLNAQIMIMLTVVNSIPDTNIGIRLLLDRGSDAT